MQILGTKSASCWHRRMRCLLLCALESPTSSSVPGSTGALPKAYATQCGGHPEAATAGALMQAGTIPSRCARYQVVAKTRCHQPCRTCASTTESASKGFQWLYRGGYSSALVKKVPMNMHSRQNGYMLQCQRWLSDYLKMKATGAPAQSYLNQDLKRFLVEVCVFFLNVVPVCDPIQQDVPFVVLGHIILPLFIVTRVFICLFVCQFIFVCWVICLFV